MELKCVPVEGPWSGGAAAPASGAVPGVVAAHLSGVVVPLEYHIVPDIAVIRLARRRRLRRRLDNPDLTDRTTLKICNSGSAPLDISLAELRVFDVGHRTTRGLPEATDGVSARTDVLDAPKVSKIMTDAERSVLSQCAVRVVGPCPFEILPEPEHAVTVPAGAQLSLSVRFVPPSYSRQYLATFELRLGSGSTAKPIRKITCFGNFIPELV